MCYNLYIIDYALISNSYIMDCILKRFSGLSRLLLAKSSENYLIKNVFIILMIHKQGSLSPMKKNKKQLQERDYSSVWF